jgi:hypothetical protein
MPHATLDGFPRTRLAAIEMASNAFGPARTSSACSTQTFTSRQYGGLRDAFLHHASRGLWPRAPNRCLSPSRSQPSLMHRSTNIVFRPLEMTHQPQWRISFRHRLAPHMCIPNPEPKAQPKWADYLTAKRRCVLLITWTT